MKRNEQEQYARSARIVKETDFIRLTRTHWIEERDKLLKNGKKHRREEDWAELDGFDKAVLIVERALQAEIEHDAVESEDPTSED